MKDNLLPLAVLMFLLVFVAIIFLAPSEKENCGKACGPGRMLSYDANSTPACRCIEK
jgi:hypothetical protein